MIHIVGLGPGDERWVTAHTRDVLASTDRHHARTLQHPAASIMPAGTVSHDDLYETSDDFNEVYNRIVDRLVLDVSSNSDIAYAVPGSPAVLERTVELLRERCDGSDIDIVVHPAMSFLDLVWARLGIDPIEVGVTLIDGHRFAVEAAGRTGPLLVAHTHADWVLAEMAGAIDVGPDDAAADMLAATEVTLLMGLGTSAERIVDTMWSDMHRHGADHLTSLWVPQLAQPVGAGYVRFHELARTLRERCPWDIEQTHQSLIPHLIEETYEVVEAIGELDVDDPSSDDHFIEELGDLLYQVEFHATIAEQQGRFSIADVTAGIHDKLVRRHPHVFGDSDDAPADAAAQTAAWDRIKQAERGGAPQSVLDGVPGSLPSLAHAHATQRKAAKVGFDWPDISGAIAKVTEETAELETEITVGDPDRMTDELGDVLFAVVNVARHLGIEPETALRAATSKFSRRFRIVEQLARDRGIELHASELVVLDGLWDEAKLRTNLPEG